MTEAVVTAEFVRLFDACAGLQPDARNTLLQAECREHPEMRQLIERVLDTSAPSEHDTLIRDGGLMKWTEQLLAEDQEHPTQIGRYRVLSTLSRGGMGTVLLAVRSDLQNTGLVAIKVINRGLDRGAFLTIFDREREILASLKSHPNIVHLEDADVTRTGAPYLVMEYIDGLPLNEYCEKNELSVPDRLGFFLLVCEAVSFAHQRAIIHRDLKPNNVLITPGGIPKLLDFGIAKLLATTEREASVSIVEQKRIMTIEYASPEQVRGELLDVRTDVYSLGVVLYRLLTGTLPYDLNPESSALREKAVCEQEPKLASVAAHGKEGNPKVLPRLLSGDLDNILTKALRKRADDRYASVEQLSEDIRRHLRHEPVRARSNSWAYSTGRFIRRHRLPFLIAACFILLLISSLALVSWQARVASKEAATAEAVSEFLEKDLLEQASPNHQAGPTTKPDPDMKVRTALDRAAARIGGKFERQPEVEAAIRQTIGLVYQDLGHYAEAHKQLERTLDLYRAVLGDDNQKTVTTMRLLGETAQFQGKFSEAGSILNDVLQVQRRVLGPEHRDTVAAMNDLANLYISQGKYPQAELLLNQALTIERRGLGSDDPLTLRSMNNLAIAFLDQGKYSQAETLYGQTLEIERRIFGIEHPETLKAMTNLAIVYFDQSKFEQAEKLISQTLEIQRRVLGSEHPLTLTSMMQLANTYLDQGKYSPAETLYARTLEIERRVLGSEHPDTLISMSNLAIVYGQEGKYAQAEKLCAETLKIERKVLGPEHPSTLSAMNNLAIVYNQQGKFSQAESLFKLTLESRRRVQGPEHPDTLGSMGNVANSFYMQGKYAQAEALFNQTLNISRRVLGPENAETLNIFSDMAGMYQREGKFDKAQKVAAQSLLGQIHILGEQNPNAMVAACDVALAYQSEGKFAKSEALARKAVKFDKANRPDDWERFRAESLLGASLAGEKNYSEAETLLLEGYQGMAARKQRMGVPDWYHLDRARQWIVQLYVDWGKPEKAAEWRKAPTDL